MVTVDDYAALIDPTRLLHPTAHQQRERGWCLGADGSARRGGNPRTLPQGREFGPIPPKTLPPLTVAATLRL